VKDLCAWDDRHKRPSKGPCGGHDSSGKERLATFSQYPEALSIREHLLYLGIRHDGELELGGVGLQIGHDLIPSGIPLRVAGKGPAGQRGVPCRRKQFQARIMLRPGPDRPLPGFQHLKPQAVTMQVVCRGKACLPGPDHQHIQSRGHAGLR